MEIKLKENSNLIIKNHNGDTLCSVDEATGNVVGGGRTKLHIIIGHDSNESMVGFYFIHPSSEPIYGTSEFDNAILISGNSMNMLNEQIGTFVYFGNLPTGKTNKKNPLSNSTRHILNYSPEMEFMTLSNGTFITADRINASWTVEDVQELIC